MKNTTAGCFDNRKTFAKRLDKHVLDSNCAILSAIISDGIYHCAEITGGRINAGLHFDCRNPSNGSDSQYLDKH